MSADQQAEVKRRSSRAAQEKDQARRRRRAARPASAPQVPETDAVAAVTDGVGPSRSELRRVAKADTAKKSRRGFVSGERSEGVRKFYRETASEIRKVVWPDRETTRNLTILVICLAVVLGIVLGGIDFVLYELFEAF